MASVAGIVAGALALSGTAQARAFSRDHIHAGLHRRGENLINLRQEDAGPAVDDAIVIEAPSDPVTLQPIRPSREAKMAKRATMAPYGLMSEDTLYWGGAESTVAELWIDASGETEAMVDMEMFDDLVEGVNCPEEGATGSVAIDFLDQVELNAAGDIWSWVSQDDERSFMLMVGAGDCGWNDNRMLYRVSDLEFAADSKVATLHAEPVPWKDALHTYNLNIGQSVIQAASTASPEHLQRRQGFLDDIGDAVGDAVDTVGDVAEDVGDTVGDVVDDVEEGVGDAVDTVGDVLDGEINESFSIPFESDISGKGLSFNSNGIDVSGTCTNCTTAGSFDVAATFKASGFDIEEAFVELSTPGISATAIIALTVKGDISDTLLERSFPLFKASPAGIAIPGVVTIGPVITIAINTGISAIRGGVTLTMGGSAVIGESSSRLDFINEDGGSSEGWEPEFEEIPLEADVFVEVRAATALNAAVGIELSALETGFSAEIGADLPSLSATLRAITSLTCNACEEFQNAISGSINLGTSITAALKKKVGGNFQDLFSLSFFDASLPPLASFCEPVGPQDACPADGAPEEEAPEEEAPAEEAPAEESAPVEEAPAEESAPVEEAPAEESAAA